MTQYDVNLRDYLRIIRRRKGIIVLVPLIFAVSSFALAVVQTPRPLYRATAVVRFERAVNVTGLLQELVSYSPVGNVETQAALIKGFPVMSLAAKKLRLVPAEAPPEAIQGSPGYLRAVASVQDAVSVKITDGTSLIEISVTSPEPAETVRVANAVAEAFREDNLATRNRQVREAREFIERQLEEMGAKLQQSEQDLKAFKQANRILLFSDETRESIRRLAALEEDYTRTQVAIAETEDQRRLFTADGDRIRLIGLAATSTGDLTLVKLYGSLADLVVQRETLLVALLPSHPQIRQLDTQIASIRENLENTLASRVEILRGRGAELQRQVALLRREQDAVPAAELQLARMERDVKVAERLFSALKERHQEALIREREQVAEISLVRPAMMPRQPINPPQALPKAGIGLVIGAVMGLVLAFVVETLDTSIGAIEDVESFLGIPVLGVIPHLNVRDELGDRASGEVLDRETEEKYAFLVSLFLPNSRTVEAIRALRTNLLFSGLEKGLKTIMVTSATPMEGKTTVAINLAVVLAQLGKRTLLIEADLRNPFLHRAFGIAKEPGFTDVVIGSAGLDEAVLTFSDFVLGRAGLEGLIGRPGIDNLSLLPSGHRPPNPTEFLSAQAVTGVLAEARDRYDYVVLDCAPILPVADPTILGARVDGALVIVRVGSVARAALRRAKALLEAAQARILGVCLTGVKAEVSPDYAEMGYYRYQYGARDPAPRPAAGRGFVTGLRARFLILVLVLLLLLGVGLAAVFWLRPALAQLPWLPSLPSLPVRLPSLPRWLGAFLRLPTG